MPDLTADGWDCKYKYGEGPRKTRMIGKIVLNNGAFLFSG